jgi:hypothetical protein
MIFPVSDFSMGCFQNPVGYGLRPIDGLHRQPA